MSRMSLEPGATLFRRGQDEDEESDIWDDTALIKAYDSAINVMKTRFGDATCAEPATTEGVTKKKKKHKKNRRNKAQRDAQKDAGSKWHVGSRCRALFTDDGQLYEAVLVSVNQDAGTGVVRYLSYGNEEVQDLNDLLPPPKSQPGRPTSDTVSESECSMDWNHTHRVTTAPPPPQPSIPALMGPPPPIVPTWPNTLTPGGFSAGMPTPPMPPLIPPYAGAMSSASLPGICVPPIGAIKGAVEAGGDEDSLYSMLLSWYMSGYHTGYYQGLNETKKKTAAKHSSCGMQVPTKTPPPKDAEATQSEQDPMDKSR